MNKKTSKRRRIREWGIIPGMLPAGDLNSITDVPGVEVGHSTIIRGEGELVPGTGPVRTGVTAVWPHRENIFKNPVSAGLDIINGYGKAAGLSQIQELGALESPLLLTGTLNVGRVMDGLIDYILRDNPEIGITSSSFNPVVLECNDGYLNDLQGRHVKSQHVHRALITASGDRVPEGEIGAGTGMVAFGFKGGIGSASRRLNLEENSFHLGALVLSNFGRREELRIAGIPLYNLNLDLKTARARERQDGSVIVILATDLSLDSFSLTRAARRAQAGLARVGSLADNRSGEYVLAFSTARRYQREDNGEVRVSGGQHQKEMKTAETNESRLMNMVFQAVVESTEEAVLNSLFMASTLRGRDGNEARGLPAEKLAGCLNKILQG